MFTKHCSTKHAGWLALSFILSTGMILTTLPTAYAVPMMTNYQGTLKDKLGRPLNSVVTLTFAVYDVPASGTALWTETHPSVSVKDGMFSVVLGSKVKIPETVAQGERYLSMKVNTGVEMTPRQALVSGFFAMRAGVAESVASGSVTNDKLGAASVTSEKVADGAVSGAKLAASAVTGDKLAANVVTTDKIANGAVTSEKLSAEVQQKLAQTGQTGVPATVATLNVTNRLKIGTKSLYLGLTELGTENSLWTTFNGITSDLFIQSNPSNPNNTIINAFHGGKVGIGTNTPEDKLHLNGAFLLQKQITAPSTTTDRLYNVAGDLYWNGATLKGVGDSVWTTSGDNIHRMIGNVGVGTNDPKAKLDVNGAVKISSTDGFDATQFGKGLLAAYDSVNNEGEISSLDLTASNPNNWVYSNLTLNGGYLFLNQKQPSPNLTPEGKDKSKGNVGIGLMAGLLPKNQLDVAGSVAIGSGYAGTQTAPANGLAVEGNVGIGTTNPTAKLEISSGPGWTSNNWQKAIKVNNGNAIQFGTTGTQFGIGASSEGDSLYFFLTSTNDQTAGAYEYMRVFNSGHVAFRSHGVWSDGRWKTDIKPLQGALDNVVKLQGVSYNWNIKDYPDEGFDDKLQIGFIAQEVEPVLPELVITDDKGFKSVAYDKMTAVLVEAVKELKAQNDALKTIVCKDHPEEAICQ